MTKNKKSIKTKKTNTPKYNKPKGKLLEQIVAALYKIPGVEIQTNVDYPTTDGESTREIDVLLKTNLTGLPVEFAFQCKNEIKAIGIDKITQFYGDLEDIGIPSKYGIFVSVNGFTKDALRYAKKKGIKLLVLKGLSKDHLKSEISAAIQHNIFLIPRIEKFSIVNAAPKAEFDYQFFMFANEDKKLIGSIPDLIFNKWRNNEIEQKLGRHTIELDVPKNWFQFYEGKPIKPMKISAEVTVLAVVITIDGEAENHLLLNAETKTMEKLNTQVKFRRLKEGDTIPLSVFSTEQELKEFIEQSDIARLTFRIKLPRIISNNAYYPFSKTVAEKIFSELGRYKDNFNELTQEKFNEILFETSKNDLLQEGLYNILGREVSVIITDNNGDLVDIHLIAKKGEYEKILALKDKYLESPSSTFRNILAWAYEQKSYQLTDKAQLSKLNQVSNLLTESLKNIQTSLELNPNVFSAIKQKSELLFNLGDYDEALKTIDLIPTKEQDRDTQLFRVNILIKLKKWEVAIKDIKRIEKLLNDSEKDFERIKYYLKIHQAEILYGQGQFEQSWDNILKVWTKYPSEIIKYLVASDYIDDLLSKVLEIESRFFHIELLYGRGIEIFKMHEFDTSSKIIDYANVLLDDVRLSHQMEKEPIAEGVADSLLIQGVLERISKLLRDTGNETIAQNHIGKISEWYERTFDEEPTYLKKL